MITKRNRIALSAGLTLVAATALTACSSGSGGSTGAGTGTGTESGSTDGTTTVRMATLPWIGYGPWYVAEEQGIFEENGLDVEQTNFNTDADLNAAFVSGNVDVANVATHTALLMQQAGVPVKIVMIEDISTTADAIVVPSGVGSVEDLAGKRIAYEQGTTSDLLLNYALDSAGLSIDDVTPVPMAASDAGAALIGGQVDLAVTYEPYISTALEQGDDLELLFTAGELPGLVSDVLVVSDAYLESNPDTIEALVESWGAAIEYYDSDTEAARAIIAEAVGEDPEALTTAFEGVEYYTREENATELGGAFSEETIPLVLEAAESAGIITGDVSLEGLVDTSFVEG
ncbi:ABC transporter substrate-binding protein [Planctomonas psychrotolerans]|uniref:ABC transporter substrate-binding protein n=1 Tax=Planctomonas psychrotolerans TaxID=2528712 RepID=UPI00123BC666|nr:ABC transporter substrate-binding protein [Planctomonas psychrotolerans]